MKDNIHVSARVTDIVSDSGQGLMSLVRNAETEGSAFVSAANRLMRQLLDFAVMGLPSDEEAVFVTPTRVMMEVNAEHAAVPCPRFVSPESL